MVKKISVLALAGMLALPTLGMASGASDVAELQKKIDALSKQLDELKGAMSAQSEQNKALAKNVEKLGSNVAEMDDRSEEWDLASRIKLNGDFRSRLDWFNARTVLGNNIDNDTLWTNRFRMNMRVGVTENVDFKGRIAMYKTWGDQSAFRDDRDIFTGDQMFPVFDGNVTRTPAESSALFVDRAYVNWNNIGGLPMWFSIGRRPTTDGPPSQLRMNYDDRQATPVAYMDWPFDGLTLGYAWNWGVESLGESRIRFCYGRGFEAGLQQEDANSLDDTDFAGISWDIMKKDDRFLYLQSFMAFNLFSYPNFQSPFFEQGVAPQVFGPRDNLGNVWHTAGIYMDKVADLNYFVAGGWSQTQPDSSGMFNDLFTNGPETDNKNGYSVYLGARYDLDQAGLKFGAEFNYGSKYWLAMTPGHDDIYRSKLATRGEVYELYTIWDLPTGEALSKYAKTFMRLGYQHYEYNYSGSGDWNLAPIDIDDTAKISALDQAFQQQGLGFDPVKRADQVYLTFEAYF